MSETKGLLSVLMLAFIFNIFMYGVFDFSSSNTAYSDSSFLCNTEGGTQTGLINASDVDYSGDVAQGISHCEPEGLPWWFYALWVIIDGVVIYAFIPFVK